MSWQHDLESFIGELQPYMMEKKMGFDEKVGGLENKCFSMAGEDSDKYVKCMQEAMKRLSKEEKKFELRMAFYQAKSAECFKNASDSASKENCKKTTRDNFDKAFKTFSDSL
jgi:chlorite dismutase